MGAEKYSQIVDPTAANNPHSLALSLVGPNQRVLEFGCGEGHVTRALVAQGCTVVGLERDERAACVAAQFAEAVHVSDIERLDFTRAIEGMEFDVALFGDVLEHLRKPKEVLRSARDFLALDGRIVVSVPNIAHVDVRLSLLTGRFDYTETGLLDETHVHFFTRASLERLLGDAGFVPIEIRRVTCRAFKSELGIRRESVDPGVLTAALLDPEAETYQFVVLAVPSNGQTSRTVRFGAGAQRDELEDLYVRHAASVANKVERAEVVGQRMVDLESEVRSARQDAERERIRADELALQLRTLQQTRLVRWSRPARRLYARLRRAR